VFLLFRVCFRKLTPSWRRATFGSARKRIFHMSPLFCLLLELKHAHCFAITNGKVCFLLAVSFSTFRCQKHILFKIVLFFQECFSVTWRMVCWWRKGSKHCWLAKWSSCFFPGCRRSKIPLYLKISFSYLYDFYKYSHCFPYFYVSEHFNMPWQLACGICFDSCPPDDLRSAFCGHPYCVTCWRG